MRVPRTSSVWTRRSIVVVYAVLLTIGLTWPLLAPGLPDQHEGLAYAIRLQALADGLSQQGTHPRWIPDFAAGHGYPIFNYYPPGFSYLALPFLWLGALNAIKLVVILVTFLGALLTYDLGRRAGGFAAGLLCATLCATAPYTICNIYWRGDFAEYSAFYAAAGVLWVLWYALRRRMRPGPALGLAVSYGVFVPIHTISTLVYSVLFAGFALAFARRRQFTSKEILRGFASFGGGLALSAWYWLPALGEKHLVSTSRMLEDYFSVSKHFPELPRYFVRAEYYYPTLGPIFSIALLLVVIVATRQPRRRFITVVFALVATLCILLNMSFTEPFWQSVPLVRYIQFPWRLTGPAVLFTAIGVAAASRSLGVRKRRGLKLLVAGVIATVSVVGMATAAPDMRRVGTDNPELRPSPDRWSSTSTVDEYLPKGTARKDVAAGAPLLQTGAKVLSAEQAGTTIRAELDAGEQTEVTIRQWGFPGWHAYIDAKEVEWRTDDAGRMMVDVPPGRHVLVLELERTGMQQFAEWLSGVSIILAGLGALWLLRAKALGAMKGKR